MHDDHEFRLRRLERLYMEIMRRMERLEEKLKAYVTSAQNAIHWAPR